MAEKRGTSPGSMFELSAEELEERLRENDHLFQPLGGGSFLILSRDGEAGYVADFALGSGGSRRFTAETPAALLEAAGPLLERPRGRSPG